MSGACQEYFGEGIDGPRWHLYNHATTDAVVRSTMNDEPKNYGEVVCQCMHPMSHHQRTADGRETCVTCYESGYGCYRTASEAKALETYWMERIADAPTAYLV